METHDADEQFSEEDDSEQRRSAYANRGELGLEPKTLVITTHSVAAVGIFPSTMTVSGIFAEDEEHERVVIHAAAVFCEAVTGYPPSEVFFNEEGPSTEQVSVDG